MTLQADKLTCRREPINSFIALAWHSCAIFDCRTPPWVSSTRECEIICRYAGLDCHLILRNSCQAADKDPGLVGNLLIDRMTGAHIHQVQ